MNLCPGMRSLMLVVLALTACGDQAAPSAAKCSPATMPSTVTLHTGVATQLLDAQPGDAAWVALRDGEDGCPWSVASGDGMGNYTLSIDHDSYAVAVVCTDPQLPSSLQLIERTVAETTALHATCSALLPDPVVQAAHTVDIQLVGPAMATVDYQPYLRAAVIEPFELDDTTIDQIARAKGGKYDVAVSGHLATVTTDQLRLARAVDATTDPVIAVDITAAGDWLAFGAPISIDVGAIANAQFPDVSVDYLTSYGTFVALASADATSVETPTWPSSAVDPGDAYFEVAQWGSASDSSRTFDVERIALDPAGFTVAAPPAFDGSTTVMVDSSGQRFWAFPALSGAAGYTLGCTFYADQAMTMVDHYVNYDISAGVVGDDPVTYDLPDLSDLPGTAMLPPFAVDNTGCPGWDALAYGSTGGLATEDALAQLGVVAGIPAQLAGTNRWRSHARLSAGF